MTVIGPNTTLHYTSGGNLVNGVYAPGVDGFNLADVNTNAQLNELPAGVKGLVWLGMTDGVTAAFIAAVDSCIGNPHLYGFYLADEPAESPTIAANLKAEADYIKANVPGAISFIVEQNFGSNTNPSYYYTPANTDINLFGLDPYPVQTNVPNNLDYNIIPTQVAALEAAGVPLADIVPVYQAFGGGGYASYILPTPQQEQQILATWATVVPNPAFDYAYSWGVQSSDTALSTDPALAAVFAAHNGVAASTAPTISGTHATTDATGAAVKPFNGVTIADANANATETLTITLSNGGAGGTLSGTGLSGGTGGVYVLSGSATAVTTELDALTFTPAAGHATTTTITLSDMSSAFTTATTASMATVVCFMAGTMIRTPEGEIPIETLKAGDPVLTADGGVCPVRWLGRQTVSTVFGDPLRNWPIRIKAGALGENKPCRDLLVSPDHALLVGDALVHAGALVNGSSIARDRRALESFVYYHVELDDHSLILAENVPAETFVDNVDRRNFDNWAEHEELYPEGRAVFELPYPRAKARRQVPKQVRDALDALAIEIGAAPPGLATGPRPAPLPAGCAGANHQRAVTTSPLFNISQS